MANYFISRHPGAIFWAKEHLSDIDRYEDHLNIDDVQQGDCVYGNLPIQMVAKLCQKGVIFYALELTLPKELRGKELTLDQMNLLSCKVQRFIVKSV